MVILAALGAGRATAQPAPRIGIVSGDLGSFGGTILKSMQIPFEKITPKVPGDSLSHYGLIVVDNLFSLKDLNGAAFKDYIAQGGVLLIINPRSTGSREFAFDIFVGEYAIEDGSRQGTRSSRVHQRQAPGFRRVERPCRQLFADRAAKEWKVLARHAKRARTP
jgi:hypothetical protein